MKLLVTGGCGFVGSNLAAAGLDQGWNVSVFDNLHRKGAAENLEWLRSRGPVRFTRGDMRLAEEVESAVRDAQPDVVFHLAGQVAMTTSVADPRMDFEVNALGTLNLLEALRNRAPRAAMLYASTNKVYGDLGQFSYRELPTRYACVERPDGFDEGTALDFHSPYGCSKGAADQYVLDFARMFGMRTAVFRHSTIYGGRQFATEDQGWIGWFCAKALEVRASGGRGVVSISGSGKQVRDILHVDDAVELYFAAAQAMDSAAGHAFNVGGGIDKSLSLLELFDFLSARLGIVLDVKRGPARVHDQPVFVADTSKAARMLAWQPRIGCPEGIDAMLAWMEARS